MFDPTVIFQRTHAGRTEIHEKKAGLTQSERLVLIMVDGVTPYSGVRSKLPVLTDQRFERAVRTLQQKELVSEVFMPVDGEKPEEVERTVIDRFLQQDPLDPVTIIMAPEDERLELRPEAVHLPASMPIDQGETSEVLPPRAVLDQQDELQADEIGREARARSQENPRRPEPLRIKPEAEPKAKPRRKVPGQGVSILYWVMAISGAFILGFALARMSG